MNQEIIETEVRENFYKFVIISDMELGFSLEGVIADRTLPPVDRLSTLEDRVSLVLGEQGNTVALMKLIAKLHSDDHFLVWKNLSSFFQVVFL